ncbi:response regulator transcription factor [Pyruvatibacter sp.]|uniref:response regulator transcription factor n=1 Tax=Pyruvatibacter sp. TaxID=1981328 RepID=UPI0032ED2BBF
MTVSSRPSANTVRIALVDDHQMFLDGLAEIIGVLDERYECARFGSAADMIDAVDAGAAFDLVISDLVMPDMNGIAFVMALKARMPNLPVLVVSGIDTLPPIERILEAGARGFVSKAAPSATLNDALKTVLAGDVFLPDDVRIELQPRQRSAIAIAGDDTKTEPGLQALGERQLDVLRLIAEGCSNRQISEVLSISENTVKTHVSAIFRQLGVTRRTACINKAKSIGLIG